MVDTSLFEVVVVTYLLALQFYGFLRDITVSLPSCWLSPW